MLWAAFHRIGRGAETARVGSFKQTLSKGPFTLHVVVRGQIRLKILKPVPSENVRPSPHSFCFFACGNVHTCSLACDSKVRRYVLRANRLPSKSYSRKREDNNHRGRQRVREKISKWGFLSEISLEAEPAHCPAAPVSYWLIIAACFY